AESARPRPSRTPPRAAPPGRRSARASRRCSRPTTRSTHADWLAPDSRSRRRDREAPMGIRSNRRRSRASNQPRRWTMATVTIEGADLVVRIEGWDRVLALKSELRVPLSHVRGVQARPADAAARLGRLFAGFKAGTSIPGVIRAGTFWVPGEGTVFL